MARGCAGAILRRRRYPVFDVAERRPCHVCRSLCRRRSHAGSSHCRPATMGQPPPSWFSCRRRRRQGCGSGEMSVRQLPVRRRNQPDKQQQQQQQRNDNHQRRSSSSAIGTIPQCAKTSHQFPRTRQLPLGNWKTVVVTVAIVHCLPALLFYIPDNGGDSVMSSVCLSVT